MQLDDDKAPADREARPDSLQALSDSSSPTAPAPLEQPATRDQTLQRQRVLQAIEEHDVDALRHLAGQTGGPILLRSNAKGKQKEADSGTSWELDELPPRDDERQVRLDIDRSLVNFPHDVRDENRDQLRVKLERAILTVLRRHPALHYFQGYHDIVSVLLLTLEEDDLLIPATERLSLHVVRDSMGPGLEPTLGYLKQASFRSLIVHRLVKAIDPELYDVVSQAASMPFFALSWALTLLSHDLDSVAVLARLFDFLLAHNPSMICHLVVAILLTKKDDLVSVSETCEGDPAIIHSALSQLPAIILPPTPSEDTSTTDSRTAPSSPAQSQGPDTPSRKTAATFEEDDLSLSEDLMSSASFLGSSSDLARSPTLTASSSVSTFELRDLEDDEADLDASMISASEIEVDKGHESVAGLRRRRRPSEVAAPSGFTSALASSSLHGYEADHDHNDDVDSLHALDESMFSDPDIEGLAFQPFPSSSSSSRATEPSTPPRGNQQTSRSGNVVVSASSPPDSPSQLPPRRTVVVDELILQALELSRRYPIGSSTASSDLLVSSAQTEAVTAAVDADVSVHLASPVVDADAVESHPDLQADRVLGANSCINTWHRSMNGTLTDAEAETIVRNNEGIVFADALGPDLDETETLPEGDDESLDDDFGDADADEYDIVPSPGDADASNGRRRRRRHRRSSSTRGGRIPPLLALGPHGWLVVSGVAVAAVAYGVYRQQSGASAAAAAASSGAHGLGTARLGLGLGFGGGGGFGGAAAAGGGGGPVAVEGIRDAGAASLFGAGGRLV
ncbi:hypothetical protein B0A53_06205 [Rhodotorula sp. CCFEE 5036]|nr:hypothetical protein B0A53_06205 [Rhodotorula sp. CCFEE 5036]